MATDMKYSFHPYHNYFKTRAEAEITRLKNIFPTADIEHFGSTAIPGVGGKGVIDIYVSTQKDKIDDVSKGLGKDGYEYKESGGVPGERLFFKRWVRYPDGHRQLFHLHLANLGSLDMKQCLAFRDFLRHHPLLAEEYSNIKHKAVLAAKRYRKKIDKKKAYMQIKKPVIEKILREMEKYLSL